ncbi:TonB-dependent receptor plug domain-containing protein [Aquirhabdus parva]|nr:TonB-dependent receptor [Aquirhabdus parva]
MTRLHRLLFIGLFPASLGSTVYADSNPALSPATDTTVQSNSNQTGANSPRNSTDANTSDTPNKTAANDQVLATIVVTGKLETEDPTEISAIRKTVITQAEMINYGDISVTDALRRAAGIQMGSGGVGRSSFRGLSVPPVIQINGEAIQGGKRVGTSLVDTISVDMIDRIEVTKQASVTQASGASGGVINIILKDGQSASAPITGVVKAGYGTYGDDTLGNNKRQLNLQLDGKEGNFSYSTSAIYNRNSGDSQTLLTNVTPTGLNTTTQNSSSANDFEMFSTRMTYKWDEITKVFSDLMYSQQANTSSTNTDQSQVNGDNTRVALRLERTPGVNKQTFRLSGQWQNEDETDFRPNGIRQVSDGRQTYSAGFDGIIKDLTNQEIKYGFQNSWATIDSSQTASIQENKYAVYGEENWKITEHQILTAGLRQEWLQRSGLVDYDQQALNPAIFYKYQFDKEWSLQAGYNQSSQTPQPQQLSPVVTQATGADAGSLNNPDSSGNPHLKPQEIHSFESTLTYNSPDGGFNLTGFYRDINNYIGNVITLANGRYIQSPQNQGDAVATGMELDGRWNIPVGKAHKLLISGQVSTIRAILQNDGQADQHASGVAPYTASVGVSYQYKPWRWLSNINLGYTPAYESPVQGQSYVSRLNARTSLDISTTKRFDDGWAVTFAARNLLSTDQYSELDNLDGAFYQSRKAETVPNVLLTVEKRF